MRYVRRSRRIALEVVAGIVWSEMTVLHRIQNTKKPPNPPSSDSEEEEDVIMDIENDPYFLLQPFEIQRYVYKVLDQGIPKEPTQSRFKAGLRMYNIPTGCEFLLGNFIQDFKTILFPKLWDKLHRHPVTSDTGNYCSYFDVCVDGELGTNENGETRTTSDSRKRPRDNETDYNGSDDEESLDPTPPPLRQGDVDISTEAMRADIKLEEVETKQEEVVAKQEAKVEDQELEIIFVESDDTEILEASDEGPPLKKTVGKNFPVPEDVKAHVMALAKTAEDK